MNNEPDYCLSTDRYLNQPEPVGLSLKGVLTGCLTVIVIGLMALALLVAGLKGWISE